mgnify:CR=1 FL=1
MKLRHQKPINPYKGQFNQDKNVYLSEKFRILKMTNLDQTIYLQKKYFPPIT